MTLGFFEKWVFLTTTIVCLVGVGGTTEEQKWIDSSFEAFSQVVKVSHWQEERTTCVVEEEEIYLAGNVGFNH